MKRKVDSFVGTMFVISVGACFLYPPVLVWYVIAVGIYLLFIRPIFPN
jgi:hypothetical protein